LIFAHLAAVFQWLGHRVGYAPDRIPRGADLVVFCPSLVTLPQELAAIAAVLDRQPRARVLVVGRVATALPQLFADLDVTIVKGEAEQLLWRLDDVLDRPKATVQLGTLEDLDRLPPPDWSPLGPGRFRLRPQLGRFPTALVESGRGCGEGCPWCPHAGRDPPVRLRQPQAVADEIARGVQDWGFRSFKFVDPLFGREPARVFQLARHLGRLAAPIEFSVRTRPELLRPEMLRVLRRVGLGSITVDVPPRSNDGGLISDEAAACEARLGEFLAHCRSLGIRTGVQLVLGFPDDTEASFRTALDSVRQWNLDWAEFRLLTPYPGTDLVEQLRERIDDFSYSRYTGHTPLWRYAHLDAERVRCLEAACYRGFYFRWQQLCRRAGELLPRLGRFVAADDGSVPSPGADCAHDGPPRPASGAEVFRRKGLRQDGPPPRPGLSSDNYADREEEEE
jgi:radical SAM superfamily enzyme YgiQ (UPF0313 family)